MVTNSGSDKVFNIIVNIILGIFALIIILPLLHVLSCSFSLMGRRLKDCGICCGALVLNPPAEAAKGLLDMEAMEGIMEAGYAYARSRMGEIRAFVESRIPPGSGTSAPGFGRMLPAPGGITPP